MNIKYIAIILAVQFPTMASAKLESATRSHMMQDASQAFNAGMYDEAHKTYYGIYVEDGDQLSKELLDKCKKCHEILSKAFMDERNGLYALAIENYEHILKLNPLDPQIPPLRKNSKAKLYAPSLQESKDSYREGKYIDAQSKLFKYLFQTGLTDIELSTSINLCIESL